MSWKGFQKGLVRTPQNLRHKIQRGSTDSDPVFADAEDRFNAIETETRKLQAEARRFHTAVTGMLAHQLKYAEVLMSVYQPISGRMSDPNQQSEQLSQEATSACDQYRQQVTALQALVQPELEIIEQRIVRPADEMLGIMNSTKKMFTKREHKRLDLERHEQNLRKTQDKKGSDTVRNEEKIYKVENEYEMALEEFQYYNNLLKTELPKLFELQGNFIRPLFLSFYYMQISVFYALHEHMEAMRIPYFDLQSPLVEGFEQRRGNVQAQADAIDLLHFKERHKRRAMKKGGFRPGASKFQPQQAGGAQQDDEDSDPWWSSDDEKCAEAPPQPPKPARPGQPRSAETVTAQYDFAAQNAGDLTFHAGDVITVISKDNSGWWRGELNGQEGLFPANYVA